MDIEVSVLYCCITSIYLNKYRQNYSGSEKVTRTTNTHSTLKQRLSSYLLSSLPLHGAGFAAFSIMSHSKVVFSSM